MKKAIADQWVKALRSKKYKQGEGALRNEDNEFCCLGVLCNLHAQAKPKFAAKQTDPEYYDKCSSFPSPPVQNWAGLKSYNGKFWGASGRTSLADLNDEGETFFKIANIIEKNWRKL